ncbi:MAG: Crp/Fnr family transcriptional regulator [Ruminococcaceae bacterium]|nr:Crp/Fnr family transcriptional regulator [Oscillospiraceae bacterium]
MEKETLNMLLDIPLFKGANEKLLSSLLIDGSSIRSFNSGEAISPCSDEKNLVVILGGSAEVLSADTERKVLLRTLAEGDVFGVAELFGRNGGDEVSRVVSKGKSKVLFLPESKVGELLERDRTVMYNYLNFLCCRIRFLNRRITCFTAGSAERRLALYLDSLFEESDDKNKSVKVTPDVSMNALALTLDIGRASLYRALETLTEDGFIEKDGKSFLLKDREKMIKKYNK